ncbi:MAG: BlaI/MecI/CopY family transcriptional regulator [Clostridia bacterium]|nr:BlaI/MecI/CopY family transcriptional regulator [Clostridia bacterium]MBO7162131.1 BlaI/MecI/CopY family transcriptional regulator [Clostridia bacterium]MBO7215397.1 BlaI/MecI/CopY family transcriptional regulator [Clostridia bacterium]MBO7246003.1 BlaI/MecI/CopY family transcriptional regulator [Clostridia bacterium]MBQ5842669.1 BlaI/MecI/CopY family transcriptional regulator [Clostridia bacterium]
MNEIQLGVIESKFADIIWENEPLSSSALVKLCEERLTWKKSTTFTVLRRLCDKGLFKNEKGVVSSLISKQDFYSLQSERFVEDTFDGSLPAFIAAFTARKKLSKEEILLLRNMIDEYKEEQ